MLLNNYYAYKKLMFSGNQAYNGFHPENLYFTDVTGRTFGGNNSPNANAQYSYMGDLGYWLNKAKCRTFPTGTASSASDGVFGVYFGTGTTQATLADHKMERPIESGLSITNPKLYTFADNGTGKWTFSASYVLTNTTGAEMNIHETGFVTPIGNDGSMFYPVLMEHTVLTEPITIPAGGIKLVTITLTQNNVLNVE